MWKRDSMLSGVYSLVDHRWRYNVVRWKRGTRGAAECTAVVANVNISVIVSVDNFASLKDSLFPIFVSGVELTCIFVCHCLKYISSCLYTSRSDISCNVFSEFITSIGEATGVPVAFPRGSEAGSVELWSTERYFSPWFPTVEALK